MTETNRSVTVSLLQMDVAIGEPDANFRKLEAMLAEAVSASVKPDIIMFPEMWNTGYSLDRIRELADPDGERTKALLGDFAREHQVHIIGGSIAERRGGDVMNTMYAFDREGRITSDYSKIHLFRLMEEEKHLTAGDRIGTLTVDDVAAGMMICYDVRFPELARKLALGGAKVLFVPAEWPHPRLHHWKTLLTARAIENQMFVVACNRVGRSGDTEFFGHSLVLNPWGETIVEGDESEQILQATLELEAVDRVRRTIPIFEDRRPGLY